MEKKNYQIGVVGYGGMGGWHCEKIPEIERLHLAGIYDIKESRIEKAKENGIATYSSYEEMLGDSAIDLILIATPNDVHKTLAIQAMEAGKHVISEKPVTLSSNDLEEMVAVSEKMGVLFTVHQNRRWDRDFLMIKNVFEQGTLGKIHRIESRVHGAHGIPGDWRQEKEHGGGMILDWGVHLLDQALVMMGNTKLSKVFASVSNVTNQIVDDGYTAFLKFENGVEFITEVGTSNFITLPRWYAVGENGTAIIEDWDLNGSIVRAAGKDETDIVPVKTEAGLTKTMAPRREDTIHKEKLPVVESNINDFYYNIMESIPDRSKLIVKLPEVMRVMKLMEAIFRSSEENQVVDFE